MNKNVYLSDKKDVEIINYINSLENFSEWIRCKVMEEIYKDKPITTLDEVLKRMYPNAHAQKDEQVNASKPTHILTVSLDPLPDYKPVQESKDNYKHELASTLTHKPIEDNAHKHIEVSSVKRSRTI